MIDRMNARCPSSVPTVAPVKPLAPVVELSRAVRTSARGLTVRFSGARPLSAFLIAPLKQRGVTAMLDAALSTASAP